MKKLAPLLCLPLLVAACGGGSSADGGLTDPTPTPTPTAPAATVALVAPDTAVRGGQAVTLVARGARQSDNVELRLAGAVVPVTREADSLVTLYLPAGDAASLAVAVTVQRGGEQLSAEATLRRAETLRVADPAAAADTVVAATLQLISADRGLVPAGADSVQLVQLQAFLATMQDSLTRTWARLTPEERAQAGEILVAASLGGPAPSTALRMGARANLTNSVCNDSYAGAKACLGEIPPIVGSAISEMLPWATGVGVGVLIVQGKHPVAVGVGALVAGISAARLAHLMIDNSRQVLQRLGSAAILTSLGFADGSAAGVRAAIVDAPISLVMALRARTPTREDLTALPVLQSVRTAMTDFQQFWVEITEKVGLTVAPPDVSQVAAATRDFAARAADVAVAQVRGAAGYSATVEPDAQGDVAVRLTGPVPTAPVRVTVDLRTAEAEYGQGTQSVEFELAAPRDTLDAIRQLFEGQIWGWEGAEFIQPWTASYAPGVSLSLDYCYGDPAIRVRCFTYRFSKNSDGSIGLTSISGFNGFTLFWPYWELSSTRLFMSQDATNPYGPDVAKTTFTRR